MKVLWVCNIMLPAVARELGMEASNKEGWLTGLSGKLLEAGPERDISLAVCFPVGKELDGLEGKAGGLRYFGFYEDTVHEEAYDAGLEERLKKILDAAGPDVLHVFGTEFGHSFAAAKAFGRPERTLVGIQGVCSECARVYLQGIPEYVRKRTLFRDFVKKDNLVRQQEKFYERGTREKELLRITGNITGRTEFDRQAAGKINPGAEYYFMNETLRGNFYQGQWRLENCERRLLFMSQGNYPVKGLHYALEAVGRLKREYPDIRLAVAGDVITAYRTLKDRLKIGSYGKYLLELIKKYKIEENVIFTGKLDASRMKEYYLKAHILLSTSVLENSPNSVGEAMLLGVPVVSSDAGGVRSMVSKGEGLLYGSGDMEALCGCIRRVFEDDALARRLSENGRKRAVITHDPGKNFDRLMEIYGEIAGK